MAGVGASIPDVNTLNGPYTCCRVSYSATADKMAADYFRLRSAASNALFLHDSVVEARFAVHVDAAGFPPIVQGFDLTRLKSRIWSIFS